MVEDLTKRFSGDPNIGIAYIYCHFRRKDEQKIDDVLASLLKQLAAQRPYLPQSVKDLYDMHMKRKTRPSFDEITKSLEAVAAMYSMVYIIIDALDECQVVADRNRLLSKIANFQTRSEANVFATSRPSLDIAGHFKGDVNLEIRASSADVERYLDGHMDQLRFFVRQNQQLQEEIKTGISSAVDGMYV